MNWEPLAVGANGQTFPGPQNSYFIIHNSEFLPVSSYSTAQSRPSDPGNVCPARPRGACEFLWRPEIPLPGRPIEFPGHTSSDIKGIQLQLAHDAKRIPVHLDLWVPWVTPHLKFDRLLEATIWNWPPKLGLLQPSTFLHPFFFSSSTTSASITSPSPLALPSEAPAE